MLSAIIVAGGSSRRVGYDKLTLPIAGRTVIGHTIAAFQNCGAIDDIVLVVRPDRISEFHALLDGRFNKLRHIIGGGLHRQDSVRAGLSAVNAAEQFVAVHDAARPLVTAELIEKVFEAARKGGAATAASRVSDTLKRAAEGKVVGSVDRRDLFAMQTPQIFTTELLRRAYEKVFAEHVEITDEVSAVEALGEPVFLVLNEQPNLKLTYESDLKVAEMLLRAR